MVRDDKIENLWVPWIPKLSTLFLILFLCVGITLLDFSAYKGSSPNSSSVIQPSVTETDTN